MFTPINRRKFLVLTATGVCGCSCEAFAGSAAVPQRQRIVDAGPVADYAADGLYARFRDQGFFIVRDGDKLFAISAFCTHRKYKLTAGTDHSFYCKGHGSTFDPEGKVTEGPARRDLPKFPITQDENRRLLVTIPAT
jgi:Rieske Fe-S protein